MLRASYSTSALREELGLQKHSEKSQASVRAIFWPLTSSERAHSTVDITYEDSLLDYPIIFKAWERTLIPGIEHSKSQHIGRFYEGSNGRASGQ